MLDFNDYIDLDGCIFTKTQFKKIANIVPSNKIMDSKVAYKSIEDGQIEGLK